MADFVLQFTDSNNHVIRVVDLDATGQQLPILPASESGNMYDWSSSNPGIISVDPGGVETFYKMWSPGICTIHAKFRRPNGDYVNVDKVFQVIGPPVDSTFILG